MKKGVLMPESCPRDITFSRPSVVLKLIVLFFICAAAAILGAVPGTRQADIVGNHFVYGPDGDLYAFAKTRLFRATDEQGANWEGVVDGVTNLAIDPTNGKILYAVTAVRPIR